jgi:hypothetical protein
LEFASKPEAVAWNFALPVPAGVNVHVKKAVPFPEITCDPGVGPVIVPGAVGAPPILRRAEGAKIFAAACPKLLTVIITVTSEPTPTMGGTAVMKAVSDAGDCMSTCGLDESGLKTTALEFESVPEAREANVMLPVFAAV